MVFKLAANPGSVFEGKQPSEINGGRLTDRLFVMTTRDMTLVRRGPSTDSAVTARISPGAVIRVGRSSHFEGCPAGWMTREDGDYICAKHLSAVSGATLRPAQQDLPNVLEGSDFIVVVQRGPKLYRQPRDVLRRAPIISLLPESVLTVRGQQTIGGRQFYQTRGGLLVDAMNTSRLAAPIGSLAIEVHDEKDIPGGVTIAHATLVYVSPDASTDPVETLARWSMIPIPSGRHELPVNEAGWITLPNGRYVRDTDVARWRRATPSWPKKGGERWLAIDLAEQLLHAYEGDRLVKIIPCSTGKEGNTKPGEYKIQWKRRLQTMQLRQGRVRVEDVQWVMYYDKKNGFAIHSAYWHSRFGNPSSHGCINLPPEDARWVFEWSGPRVLPEDSERLSSEPKDRGSRVIVFR